MIAPLHTKWTPERTERLKVLAAEGAIGSEIAAELGMTRNAIIGKIHRMIAAGMMPTWTGARSRVEAGRQQGVRNNIARKQAKQGFVRPSTSMLLPVAVVPSAPPGRRKHRRPCKLASLKLDSCRWPMWGPDTPPKDWRFCNTIAPKGCSYCAEHYHMAYRPVRERQRDAA